MRGNRNHLLPLAPLFLQVVLLACGGGPPEGAPSRSDSGTRPAPAPEAASQEIFVDRAEARGLAFHHINGMSGAFYYPEMMGSGAGLFDYDNDGDLDVYLVQGGPLEPSGDPASFPADRLFRNDLTSTPNGSPHFTFTDVTTPSGLSGATGYGMGVVVFDFDDDGWSDLYLTNLDANQLWRNRGDGTFSDHTAASGTGLEDWSVPAAVLDYDADGWLDLFVGNYVIYDRATDQPCRDELGADNYCGPLSFRAAADQLLRNRGDGTFVLSTEEAGLAAAVSGRTLGAITSDFDGDGRWDLYTGNDGTPNHLWIQSSPGTFEDRALMAGTAVNRRGVPEASMGIAAADLEGDGDEDLFLTHLSGETHTLYLNDGQGSFRDHTTAAGLGPPSLPSTGFGTGWLDYDNDGRLDLLAVNGAVKVIKSLALAGDPFPLHQPNQLFQQQADGRFIDRSHEAGAALALSEVSRGAAFGDIDNDGDTDVLISNNNGPVRLLINQVGQSRDWLGLALHGARRRHDPGTLAALLAGDTVIAWRRVQPGGSYGSANDPRLLFAPGAANPTEVRVRWNDGTWEAWDAPPLRQYSELSKGSGRPTEPPVGLRKPGDTS